MHCSFSKISKTLSQFNLLLEFIGSAYAHSQPYKFSMCPKGDHISTFYCIKSTTIPALVGRASGPPSDGWRSARIASSLSGTEWSSHSYPEEDSGRRDLLYPARQQEDSEMLASITEYGE